jgi:hypothetical protein
LLRYRYKQNQRCSGGFCHAARCDPLIGCRFEPWRIAASLGVPFVSILGCLREHN